MPFLPGFAPRRPLLATLSGLAPAAASFFGLRVGRELILRLSSLLALRTLLSAVSLPLDDGVVSYVWSFLFASVQASVALAAAASYLDVGGIIGAVVRRWLAAPADAAFVRLYATLVLIIGPLLALLEAAVVTFEVMRLSRAATDRMFAAEAKGEGTLIRKAVFAASGACAMASVAIIYLASTVYPGDIALVMGSVLAAMYIICIATEDGHLLETAVLALLAQVTLAVGLIEEFDAPTHVLDSLLAGKDGEVPREFVILFGNKVALRSQEVRALVLMYTTTMLLTAMARAPRFVRLVQVGADRLENEEKERESANAPGDTGLPTMSGLLKGAYNAVVLMAVTFRLLIWTGQVHNSEYMPALCRGVQVIAMILLHRGYLGREEEQAVPVPEPVRDIAGNVVENPIAL